MAGGVGSRFWPLSRKQKPKQFLDILGTGRTLIQMTFDRFSTLFPAENFLVVTNSEYKQFVAEQLPDIPIKNILTEPARRNTAPCVAYANCKIEALNPNANIVVTPADHLIIEVEKFRDVISESLDFTKNKEALLTLGMLPTRPETGYGYIQAEQGEAEIKPVKIFTEKPNLEMAQKMVESGEFFWNSGIFIWSLKSITSAFNKYLPEVVGLFAKGIDLWNTAEEPHFLEQTYAACRNVSIDIGVMEKADNVNVLCADFGWSDLGTWGALYENFERDEKNNAFIHDNVIAYDTKNCVVHAPKNKLVITDGLDDYIIADTHDALLIYRKSKEQEIRGIVNTIKLDKGEDFV